MKWPAVYFILWLGVGMVSVSAQQDPVYVATFSMAGASGYVKFAKGAGQQTMISVNMTLPAGTYDWAVHERPTLYDQRPACNATFTGGVLSVSGDLSTAHGPLTGGGSHLVQEFNNAQLKLSGQAGISGRSLVLVKRGSYTSICANILDFDGDVVTAVARFMTPFAGTVTFRQRQGSQPGDTSILVDLYAVLGSLESTTYQWSIHSVLDYNKDMDLSKRCINTMSSIYNPSGADASSCRMDDLSTCPVGALSSKLGDITVNPVPTSRTQYSIDTNLPLSQDTDSILGKNLVFSDKEGTFIACSPIHKLLPKTVRAEISQSQVKGSLVFSQRSPFDATRISVYLSNLQGLAGGYHVHENPTAERITAADQPASGANAGGHYNPFGVNAGESPSPGTGTHDQYEVGDISGKFGLLTGLNDYSAHHVDWNMQLFGKYSIIGRSIVIHKTEANARWSFGDIGYPTDIKTIKADFRSIVAGEIVFRQDPNDPYSDTTIYIDVVHANGADATSNHNFHVHETPVQNDYSSEKGRCASTAGHFNPFVDVKNFYYQCGFSHPLRCEVGDLSQKLSTINIPGAGDSSGGKYFFTDPHLPLTGVYSISDRSVVIHMPDRGAPRYACADLYDVPSLSLESGTWVGGGQATSGSVLLSQSPSQDGRTQINILPHGFIGSWYIHSLPTDPTSPDGVCGAASVQDVFNPFQVNGSPATGATHDMYSVGDLSGKFGDLTGGRAVYQDSNLPLAGPRSVAGRSIVIRDQQGSGTAVCSDVAHALSDGDFTLVARATFQGQHSGVVTFKQVRFAKGHTSDTTLMTDLTADVNDIDYRLAIPSNSTCTSGSLYNPYRVDLSVDRCSISRMRLCAVGDLVTKHGMVLSNRRVLFTDVNLPLYGLRSVIGRHLVVTTPTGDARCAPITPDENSGRRMTHVFPSTTTFQPYDFQTIVATAVAGGNRWQIVPSEEPEESTSIPGCTSVGFWVIGPNFEDLVSAFPAAVQAGSLASYNPTELCSEGTGGGIQAAMPSGQLVLLSAVLCLFIVVSLQA